jgi:hypothetical protein
MSYTDQPSRLDRIERILERVAVNHFSQGRSQQQRSSEQLN